MEKFRVAVLASLALAFTASAADLSGYKLLVTSVRTDDTEVFIADPTTPPPAAMRCRGADC
jgi:hypothetical protein